MLILMFGSQINMIGLQQLVTNGGMHALTTCLVRNESSAQQLWAPVSTLVREAMARATGAYATMRSELAAVKQQAISNLAAQLTSNDTRMLEKAVDAMRESIVWTEGRYPVSD